MLQRVKKLDNAVVVASDRLKSNLLTLKGVEKYEF
jgi:hypothetical protein